MSRTPKQNQNTKQNKTMQQLISSQQPTRGELGVSAQAAGAKALIEARFTVAMHRPRNVLDARTSILESCRRPGFAASALYAKPIGGSKITGLSIRFAESALQAWGNVDVSTSIVWEDDAQRQVRISIVDLERNITYSEDIILAKTVERRSVREGQVVLSKRENSTGETVFLIAASEDELATKVGAARSKAIRNSGLRLIPGDILEEARAEIEATRRNGSKAQDPNADLKKVVDAFASLRVSASMLADYLRHPVETASPAEIDDLRSLFVALREGETNWAAVMESVNADNAETPDVLAPAPKGQDSGKPARRAKTPGNRSQTPPAQAPAPAPTPSPTPAPGNQVTPSGSGSLFSGAEETPEPAPATPAMTPQQALAERCNEAGVTEGEVLEACAIAKVPVGKSLASTSSGVAEMILQDWDGLVTLIEHKVRKTK